MKLSDIMFESVKMTPLEYAKYCANDLKRRDIKIEDKLKKSPIAAIYYAKSFFPKGWKEAEPYIINDTEAAFMYADEILNRRWPEYEAELLDYPEKIVDYRKVGKESFYPVLDYCELIVKRRVPEFEQYIKKNKNMWSKYKEIFDIEE